MRRMAALAGVLLFGVASLSSMVAYLSYFNGYYLFEAATAPTTAAKPHRTTTTTNGGGGDEDSSTDTSSTVAAAGGVRTPQQQKPPLPRIRSDEAASASASASAAATIEDAPPAEETRIGRREEGSSYTSPLPENITSLGGVPASLQVLERYKRWHSVTAIRNDPDPQNRRFLVGLYACPVSAGNRLLEIINDLLFAVMMNRTLLWKYYDADDCVRIRSNQKNFGEHNCSLWNTVQDCDAILTRAPWIMSYDEWKTTTATTTTTTSASSEAITTEPHFVRNMSLVSAGPHYYDDLPVITLPRKDSMAADYSNRFKLNQLGTEMARDAARDLFGLGRGFFYGMALRYLFDFSDRIKESQAVPAGYGSSNHLGSKFSNISSNESSGDDYYIAVHSRHTRGKDDGCNVTDELRCLQDLIPPGRPCRVWIMSDRECTIDRLRDLMNGTCSVHVADHEEGKEAGHGEHGPFAGAGYFQDLAAASSGARHGVVGSHHYNGNLRSSSAILYSLIDFNRRMEAWLAGEDITTVEKPRLCKVLSPNPGKPPGRRRSKNNANTTAS